jgi:hypothetical protein
MKWRSRKLLLIFRLKLLNVHVLACAALNSTTNCRIPHSTISLITSETIALTGARLHNFAPKDAGAQFDNELVAAIGSGGAFATGRDFSAWIGLVPKQMSTGIRTISGASPSEETVTCTRSSCKQPGSFCKAGKLAEAWSAGTRLSC